MEMDLHTKEQHVKSKAGRQLQLEFQVRGSARRGGNNASAGSNNSDSDSEEGASTKPLDVHDSQVCIATFISLYRSIHPFIMLVSIYHFYYIYLLILFVSCS